MAVLEVSSAPVTLWTTLDEAKDHLRVTGTTDDAYITSIMHSVQDFASQITWRAISTTTYVLYLDAWPANKKIILPRPPVSSVSSVKYYDSDNSLQTLATSKYVVDSVSEPGRICEAFGEAWPTTYERPNAIEVTYIAGWSNRTDIPAGLRQAMLFTLGHFFEYRQPVVMAPNIYEVPLTIRTLYRPYRVDRFF